MGNACCGLFCAHDTKDEPLRKGDDVPATNELSLRSKMTEVASNEKLDETRGRWWQAHMYMQCARREKRERERERAAVYSRSCHPRRCC